MKKVKDLLPADYNPRKISTGQLNKLVKSIEEFGFVEPVVINKDNTVISGHQRLKAAHALGMEEVPVIQIDIPKGKEKALNIAMNRISGEWDEEKLQELLQELTDEERALTGMEEKELAEALALCIDEDGLSDDFSLKDGDRSPFTQITFTLADAQAEEIVEVLKRVSGTQEYKQLDYHGNENRNGNALFALATLWASQNT
jgi:ParB-like chromosome segregation protein Spo0J